MFTMHGSTDGCVVNGHKKYTYFMHSDELLLCSQTSLRAMVSSRISRTVRDVLAKLGAAQEI
jgi:hypothetical protein